MNNNTKSHPSSRAGFSLIELMVTIVIIFILVGIILGVATVANKKSAEGNARARLQEIANALEDFRVKYGRYPGKDYFYKASNTFTTVEGRQIDLIDPYGNNYVYTPVEPDRASYNIKSLGLNTTNSTDDINHTMENM